MKAIILAAGFGTRLEKGLREYSGPHSQALQEGVENKPKGLVPIRGKPVVGYHVEQFQRIGIPPQRIYVHTNAVYVDAFREWARYAGIPLENIFSNGVTRHQDRKEQVGDMLLAFQHVGYDDPVILFANDTLVYGRDGNIHNLTTMVGGYNSDHLSRVAVYFKGTGAEQNGVVTFDENFEVTSFREKPAGVQSGHINASVYLFSPKKLQEMRDRTSELIGYKNPLEVIWPGFKVELVSHRLDIGTIEDVLAANGWVGEQ